MALSRRLRGILKQWRDGEIPCSALDPVWDKTDDYFLRIRKIGSLFYVESDSGYRVMLVEAEHYLPTVLRAINRAIRKKEDIDLDIYLPDSKFTVSTVGMDGRVLIGCTWFSAKEIRLFARTLKAFRAAEEILLTKAIPSVGETNG